MKLKTFRIAENDTPKMLKCSPILIICRVFPRNTSGKRFVDAFGKILHVNFLGYSHWFMSFRVSQLKDHSISVDQAKYDNSVVAKYLDTATIK